MNKYWKMYDIIWNAWKHAWELKYEHIEIWTGEQILKHMKKYEQVLQNIKSYENVENRLYIYTENMRQMEENWNT